MYEYYVAAKCPGRYKGKRIPKGAIVRMPIRDAIRLEKKGLVELKYRIIDERMNYDGLMDV